MELVDWHGKCNADEIFRGAYEITVGKGGTYALVFDNTFSKSNSKTVHFSQRVVPVAAHSASQSTRDLTDSANQSTALLPAQEATTAAPTTNKDITSSKDLPCCISDGRHLSGVMLKKKRKKLQGFTRRYFSLDYKYGVLNYYASQSNQVLRGSMPIKLCVVSARARTRDIYIDSGMEVWNVRPLNSTDFDTWVAALDVARQGVTSIPEQAPAPFAGYLQGGYLPNGAGNRLSALLSEPKFGPTEPTNDIPPRQEALNKLNGDVSVWDRFESLAKSFEVSAQKFKEASAARESSVSDFTLGEPTSDALATRRASFWKRKSRQYSSGTMLDVGPTDMPPRMPEGVELENPLPTSSPPTPSPLKNISQEIFTLVEELRRTVADARTSSNITSPVRRQSVDINSLYSSDEFFDAKENDGVLLIERDESSDEEEDEEEFDESADSSDVEGDSEGSTSHLPHLSHDMEMVIEESKGHDHAKDLYPLTLIQEAPKRRTTVPAAVCTPPNFLTIIRKNVGKDMTSVAMPVTSNEPLNILQRFTEIFESASLLDSALEHPASSAERILHVAAFAAVFIASSRAKERSGRKPFVPLLGETFELVRPEQGMRVITEKVSHRPQVMAMQAEAAKWTLQYSASLHQQIWGKSIEINQKGTVRLSVIETGEVYEWQQPTTFIRNIIAGEKYIEPVGKLSVACSNGWRAVVDYKAGGMFSGRSEDLRGKAFAPGGKEHTALELEGQWTSSIALVAKPSNTRTQIWHAGPLVDGYPKRFGFTQYAASLNEITAVEEGSVAPTDSRLRPDLRMYEQGQTDAAEARKLALEQRQRDRRGELESAGAEYAPVFFEREAGPGADQHQWRLKQGSANYWERRKNGDWAGLLDIFAS